MQKVIGVIGKLSSGKTTLANYVHEHFNYGIYEIGDYVRKEYGRTSTDMTLLEFSNAYYKMGQLSRFFLLAVRDAQTCAQDILFNGIRTLEEFLYLKKKYPQAIILKVNCSETNREHRYYKYDIDRVSFQERNQIETIWMHDLLNCITPDYTIYNDGSIDELYEKINTLFSKFNN